MFYILLSYFRFCPEKYYPFQSDEPDKYIVGDDYLPFWEVSALKTYYNNLGYSMKDSFDAYIKSTGMRILLENY